MSITHSPLCGNLVILNLLCQEYNFDTYVPSNAPEGVYDLHVFDQTSQTWIIDTQTFEIPPPRITDINPNEGNQGQQLSVQISGDNVMYEWSNSGTLSAFKFTQWSGTYWFEGTPTSYDSWDERLYGDIDIPANQNPGWYDLEVWDYGSNQWLILQDAFEVIQLHYLRAWVRCIVPGTLI